MIMKCLTKKHSMKKENKKEIEEATSLLSFYATPLRVKLM